MTIWIILAAEFLFLLLLFFLNFTFPPRTHEREAHSGSAGRREATGKMVAVVAVVDLVRKLPGAHLVASQSV